MNNLPDFDTMLTMEESDLEDLLRNEVNKVFASAPNPETFRKLKGLQLKIDSRRGLAKTPLESVEVIFGMMNEKRAELESLIEVHDLADWKEKLSTVNEDLKVRTMELEAYVDKLKGHEENH